jgi:putative redox protein
LPAGSGHTIVLDDGEGDGGARPTEALLAALAACTAMDVCSLLTKKRQKFTAYAVEARGAQQQDYPHVYTWIELVHVSRVQASTTAPSGGRLSCPRRSTAPSAR